MTPGSSSSSIAAAAVKMAFEAALLSGDGSGYAVCVKSARFEKLPDVLATTFAEIDRDNCYYVFELERDARTHLDAIPADEKLGQLYEVREIILLDPPEASDGPRLDPCGYPFAMRGILVDRNGGMAEWRHTGKLGWRNGTLPPFPLPDETSPVGPERLALSRRKKPKGS
jgi:hypothetical protein